MTVQWVATSDGWSEDAWKRICWQVLSYTAQTYSLWRMQSARGDANGWKWIGFTNAIQPLGYGTTKGHEEIRAMFSLIRGKPDIALPSGMHEMAVTVSTFQSCLCVNLPSKTFHSQVELPLTDIQRFNAWLRVVADLAGGLEWRVIGTEYDFVIGGYAVADDGIFESMADGQFWNYFDA